MFVGEDWGGLEDQKIMSAGLPLPNFFIKKGVHIFWVCAVKRRNTVCFNLFKMIYIEILVIALILWFIHRNVIDLDLFILLCESVGF